MVEQSRHWRAVVSLQAGPAEGNTDTMLDFNLRIPDRAAQILGRQLAAIGDQLDGDWAHRAYRLPTPLHMLGPARALTRNIYRDIHGHWWSFQGLSVAVKAWLWSTVPGQSVLRADAWAHSVSRVRAAVFTGWSRGVLLAALSIMGLLWLEWKA